MTDREIIIDGVNITQFNSDELACMNRYDIARLFIGLVKNLQRKTKECEKKSWEIGNLGYKIKNQRREINERLKQIEKLKEKEQECEQLKAQLETYSKMLDNPEFKIALIDVKTGERELWRKLGNKAQKYEQALDEIKLICDRTCKICEIFKMCDKEFSNCKNARIINAIKKCKGH